MSKKLTIEEMRDIAKERGGKCLSEKYIDAHAKLKWQCNRGHVWEAKPNSVKNGNWCPVCSGNIKLTIEEMKKIARERGGKCMSEEYAGNKNNLKWQCKEGHIWEASPANIKKGQWCSFCAHSLLVSERICRKYFELIFNKEFHKIKPKWLLNSHGNRMELDGYSPELKLAFEYQGRQHYMEISHFGRLEDLKKRTSDDALKKYLCAKKGLTLIEIPYTVTYENMPKFIIKECRKNNIDIPNPNIPNYKTFNIYSVSRLEEMQKIAKERGGLCLSDRYINVHTKLKWQCKKGHIWEAKPNNVKGGQWCLVCSGSLKLTIEEMRDLAKKRGGKCLSEKYVDAHTKLKWQCKEGHIWEARPYSVKQGHWCPFCFNLIRDKKND